MGMHNPPHPGEFIQAKSGITPAMALRLSKALGRSPESWLAMQHQYDLWHAKREVDLKSVKKFKFKAA